MSDTIQVELPDTMPGGLDLPESPQPPGHMNSEDLPWVEQGPGVEMKVLRISDDFGTWVVLNRFQPGVVLPTHRHSGGVTAYTLSGAWGYQEHDFVATTGSVVREPACSAHTLAVSPDAKEPAVVFFVIEGSLTHIGPDGSIWGISDAQTELARYREGAALQGSPIPDGAILK